MALENFGVNESLPEGLASDGHNMYLVGQTRKALYRINPVTAEATQIGNLTNFGAGEMKPVGLAFHQDNLYMVGRTGKCLYKVSTVTGKASKVGAHVNFGGVENKPQGLASDGQTLYMTGAQNNNLYSVETEGKEAGKAKKISSFENLDNEPRGLTYNTDESQLYMIGGEHNSLYTLDPQTGSGQRVNHPTGFDVDEERPSGITFHDGKLHLVGQQQRQLYAIGDDGVGQTAGSDIIRTGGLGDIGLQQPGGIGRPDSAGESGSARPQSGGESRLLFAEQSVYWTGLNGNVGDVSSGRTGVPFLFYKYIPIVTSIGLTNQTATIPIEFLKGTASANKQQQGGFAYSGGFSIGASSEGTQLFFKGITGAKIDDRIVTNDLTRTTSKNAAIDLTAANTNLGASSSAIPISLTPGTPVNLSGIDLTSSSTPDNRVYNISEGTGPEKVIGHFPISPQRLWINGAAGKKIIITGYDYHNQKIREVLTTTGSPIPTKTYFRHYVTNRDNLADGSVYSSSASAITIDAESGTTGSVDIYSCDETQSVVFNLNDNKEYSGWTVEAQKGGGVCHTYTGVVPVSFSTSLSRDQALTFDFECLAYGMNQYQNAENQDTKVTRLTTPGLTNDPRPSAGMDIRDKRFNNQDILFKQSDQQLATGWQSYLQIATPGENPKVVPLLDATFTVNQTIEQAMVIMGERNPGPYFRSGLREVTLSGNMLLTQDRDWITEFEENSTFTSCTLIFSNVVTAGFPYRTIFKFGKGQLTTAPDASVDGLGLISMPFNMSFFDDSTTPQDFKIIAVYSQDSWFRKTKDNVNPLSTTNGRTALHFNGGLNTS